MKAEDEVSPKNMDYYQKGFIDGLKQGKESQLQALKEEVEKHYRNAYKDGQYSKDYVRGVKSVLNLITNLEDK